MKKKTYPEENERNEEKGRDQNYSFGRIPRANKRNRAINVRNKVPCELPILHLERDVELATCMIEPVTLFLAPFLCVLRCTSSHLCDEDSAKRVCELLLCVCGCGWING